MKLETRLGELDDVDAAALVWAKATAVRDGDDEVASLVEAREVLLGRLRQHGSKLIVGTKAGTVVAFAVTEPASAVGTAELCYLGVDPDCWGLGLGRMILSRVDDELASAGFDSAELLVYADNVRARRLYESMGWELHGEPSVHLGTDRAEVRYRRALEINGSRPG